MSMHSLHDVYVEQLKDMYSAEKQLTEALPQMANAASNTQLSAAFKQHFNETKTHMDTVRVILDELGENPGNTKCKGMEGLLEEGQDVIKKKGDPEATDVALIVAAQKVEHYEIASYGALTAFAQTMGHEKAARVLQTILDQEYETDQKLDNIAMGVREKAGLNTAAKA
jgi:ferritin-like metal-binding protein YciE